MGAKPIDHLDLCAQGVAFATLAGMPPQYGLYLAMVPAVVAALWGSSRQAVSGPTTAVSLFVFATLSPLASPGSPEYVQLALTLSFMAGAMMGQRISGSDEYIKAIESAKASGHRYYLVSLPRDGDGAEFLGKFSEEVMPSFR